MSTAFEIGTIGGGIGGQETKTCFPAGFDRSKLIDVTRVGDCWARFVDEQTGEEVNCETFYRQLLALTSKPLAGVKMSWSPGPEP